MHAYVCDRLRDRERTSKMRNKPFIIVVSLHYSPYFGFKYFWCWVWDFNCVMDSGDAAAI